MWDETSSISNFNGLELGEPDIRIAMPGPPPSTSVLAVGTFAVGTSGYIVAGLLPALTGELHVSASAAAQLVTAFAIAYAIGSPLFAAVTGRWERRRLGSGVSPRSACARSSRPFSR
jgi:MFS family permease